METDQLPVPPPASASPTRTVPPFIGNEIELGEAKKSGLSALTRSTSPPPSRSTETSWPRSSRTGSPVWTSADLICATVQSGWRCMSRATAPETCGAAMLVPDIAP